MEKSKKKYKVIDILNLADQTYSLYFDKDNKDNKINTYTRQIRKTLEKHGYHKPFNNIRISDVYYLVEHELKDYFISNSVDSELLEKDKKLIKQYENKEERLISQQQDPHPDDALCHDSLIDVINAMKSNEYDPISKLEEICSSGDDEFGIQIQYLDKLLSKFKQEYIFNALLKLNKEEFDQKQFIKDYFERSLHIDDRTMIGVPKYGYSKYNDKLTNPISSYVHSSNAKK